MSKAKEIFRDYKLAEMLQSSSVLLTLFTEDSAAFIDFDADFGAPFSENWSAAITAAEEASHDVMLVDQLSGLTLAVDDKMDEARKHYQKLKYYIEKAFPENKPVQNEFGFNDYNECRKSTAKLINFMTMLNTTAVKYSAEITAAGVKEEDITKILTIRDELKNADHDQEVFKKNRPLKTQQRVEDLNACWDFAQKVCRAGKIIFEDNAVKYNQYVLPGETKKVVEEV